MSAGSSRGLRTYQRLEVVDKRHEVAVVRLVVPLRTAVANGWGHPQAREVWERVAMPFRPGGPGFDVVAPQTLSIDEQLRLA